MTNQSVNPRILRESDFYSDLKKATDNQDKSAFALILAMLSEDAREFDEFKTPKSDEIQFTQDLKKSLFVRNMPLTGEHDKERSLDENKMIHQGDKATVVLNQCLNPEPLCEPQPLISNQIIDNLDLNTKNRYLSELPNKDDNEAQEPLSQRNGIDVDSWFNVLHQARTLSVAA